MVVRLSSMALGVLALLLWVTAAQAQTLDSENERLLSNNCTVLGHNAAADDPNFGPGLDLICQMPGSGSGSSAGGNSASSATTAATVADRREERLEGESEGKTDTALGGGLNLFFAGDYESLDRHRTTFEDGYQSDVWRGTGGVDVLVGDTLLVGGFFTYANNNGDFRAGGDFDTDSYTPTLFGSFMPMPNIFADASVSYTRHEYDRDRRATYTRSTTPGVGPPPFTISGKASSDTSGDQVGATFAFGYDHSIDNITVGPRAGLNFTYQEIDSYREKGTTGLELNVSDQYVKTLQSVVGLEATMAISTSFGVLLPRIIGDYVHEFENDQRDLRVNYVQDLRAAPTRFVFENQDPDRDFFHIGAGLVLVMANGLQPFVNLRALLGNSHFDNYAGTVGVRIEM